MATGRLAHPTRHADVLGWEERLVQALQLFHNTGRETEPLSYLWFTGHNPAGLHLALGAWLRREEGWADA